LVRNWFDSKILIKKKELLKLENRASIRQQVGNKIGADIHLD
jgi:hypothetical protein